MGSGKKGVGGNSITNGRSLAEIKAMHANQMQMGKNIEQVIDYRKQELHATMQQLYTQVEDFRLNQHSELRREIEVSWDLAIRELDLELRSRPWWKRLFGGLFININEVEGQAEVIIQRLKARTIQAHKVAEAEAEQRVADEKARQVQEEKARIAEAAEKKRQEELIAANPILPAQDFVDAPARRPGALIDDGYGGTVEAREEKFYEDAQNQSEEGLLAGVKRHKIVEENEDGTIDIGSLKPGETKEIVVKAEVEKDIDADQVHE